DCRYGVMRRPGKIILIGGLIAAMAGCTAQPVQDVESLPSATPPGLAAPAALQPRTGPINLARAVIPSRQKKAKPRIDEVYRATSRRVREDSRGRAAQPGDVRLDFRDTNVKEVVRAVLGGILKVNFIIDPNVTGKVTLSTARPLHQDELIPTLETVLASLGVKLVGAGPGLYRVTRASGPAALSGGGMVSTDADGTGAAWRVFPLQYISAAELAKILRPILPAGSVLQTDEIRNLLITGGAGDALRLAERTIDIFDIDQMADQNMLLISIENTDATVLVNELRSVFRLRGDSGGPGDVIRFITIDRLNAILALSSQEDYIEQAREWIYRLDREHNPADRRLFVYYVQNGRAERLVESLREVVGNIEEGDGEEQAARSAPQLASIAGRPGIPGRVTTALAKPKSADARGAGLRISANVERNALLISATHNEYKLIEEVLAKLDLPALQVMIETTIFEVALNDTLRYGIQYALFNGDLGIGEPGTTALTRGGPGSTAQTSNIITPIIAPLVPGFSFAIDGASRSRFIFDALSQITELNVLSSPNILVLNHQPARLQVGDEVPIITQQSTATVGDNPQIVNSVQYRSTGVSLEVTPHVNASGLVTLEIAQNVSNTAPTLFTSIDSLTIQNRSLATTVSVKSGESVMLGGLIREQATEGNAGIPFLHELPLVGFLFGQQDSTSLRSELVIMIRPIVLTSPADAQHVTKIMQRKFHALLRNQSSLIPQPRRLQSR
ncbi:MAG: type II secretion system secretin GspD, partial [Alphaproteobacteria bacterium]